MEEEIKHRGRPRKVVVEDVVKEVVAEPEVVEEPQRECITLNAKYIEKDQVLKVIDDIIGQSAKVLASPIIRSAEARAMLNGIKNGVKNL